MKRVQRREGFKIATLSALKMEEDAMSQGRLWKLEQAREHPS